MIPSPKIFLTLLLLSFVIVSVGACDQASIKQGAKKEIEGRVEKATGKKVDVDIASDRVTIKSGAETVALTTGAAKKSDLEITIPLPDGGEVISQINGIDKKTIHLVVSASLEMAAKQYSETLKSTGYLEKSSVMAEGMFTATFSMAGKEKITIYAYDSKDEKSSFTLVY